MSVVRPPDALVAAVERQAPGIYAAFFAALARAHSGLPAPRVTSYWRDAGHNAEVGGQGASQHLIGTAMDLVYPSWSAKSAAMNAMRRIGLIVVDEGDHVHVQAWSAGTATPLIKWLGLAR